MTPTEALTRVRKEIDSEYHRRVTRRPSDYSLFGIQSFEEQAAYHRFLMGVIDETLREVAASNEQCSC